tara:strand:+ start:80 stop:1525 length:1446 start_codon:yes stop_codon:yes gene_type:complete
MSFINSSIFKNMAIKDANKEIVVTNTDNSNNVSFHSSSSDENVDTVSIKNILNKASNMDLNICSFNNNILSPVITINNNNNCEIKTSLNMNDNIISNVGYPDANGDALNLEYYNDWTPTDLGDMTDNDEIYASREWLQEQISFTKKSYVDTGSGFDTSSDLCLEIGEESSISSANDEVYPIIKIHPPNSALGPWLNYVQDSVIDSQLVSYLGWAWNNQAIYEIDSNKNAIFHGDIQTGNITTSGNIGASGNATINSWALVGGPSSNNPYITIQTDAFQTYATLYFACWYCAVGTAHSHPYIRHQSHHSIPGLESNVSISSSSDDRIKIDEELILDATNTLLKLRPQKYKKFTAETIEKSQEHIKNKSTSYIIESGLIAQEIFYEVPELRFLLTNTIDESKIDKTPKNFSDIKNDPDYSNWSNHISTVNYTGLIPYLIQGFKEQNNEINTLKTKVSELENKNIELETKLNDLYSIVNELKSN